MNNLTTSWRDQAWLQFYVILVSFTAVLGELISLSAAALVSWRTGIAGLILLIWILSRPRKFPKIQCRECWQMIATGFILGAHWLCFFGSVKVSNVSICLTGMASISLFTAWIEPLITKRPFRREELWLSFLILVGLAWVLGFAFDHWLGLTLAILAALLAAIFPSCNRVFVQRGHSAISITAYEMLGAFTVCFVAALWQNEPMIPQGFDYLWIMILALICTVFAFALSVHLLKRLTAYTTALALNFEPVYGILLAAWIFQEHRDMGLQFYLGTLVLISANLIHVQLTRYQSRQHKRAASCSD